MFLFCSFRQDLTMNWTLAIERNREALKAILATIFLMLEEAGGAALTRMSRPLHRAVLSVLRPAESAVRRLIVIAARDLAVKPAPSRPMPEAPFTRSEHRTRLAFQLFDPRPRLSLRRAGPASRAVPRIHVFGGDPRVAALWSAPPAASAAPSTDDGRIDARRLLLRLEAVKRALDDLPREARRLRRWQAKRTEALGAPLRAPLRPGRPPAFRKNPVCEADRILVECHELACRRELDTS
jgi:hypothetical protein